LILEPVERIIQSLFCLQISRVLAQSGRTVSQIVIRLALASREAGTATVLEGTLSLTVTSALLSTRLHTIFIKKRVV
jgi:hypothetical protein